MCIPSNTCFHLSPHPNSISIGSVVFAQLMAKSPYILQRGRPFSPQNCPSHGRICTPSNTWLLGPTWNHKPNGGSIGSAASAWLTTDRHMERRTYRQTDHKNCNNRSHLHSTAMQPKNKAMKRLRVTRTLAYRWSMWSDRWSQLVIQPWTAHTTNSGKTSPV